MGAVKTPATLPLQDLKANFGNSEGFSIQTDSGRGSGGRHCDKRFPVAAARESECPGGLGLGLLKETVKEAVRECFHRRQPQFIGNSRPLSHYVFIAR
jgi:hypothetical protein